MKTQIKLIIAIAFLMAPVLILAQERGERGQRRTERQGQGQYEKRGQRIADILDLTEAQQSKIEDIHASQMKTSLQSRNKLNEHRARLQTLRSEDSPDMKEINRTIDQMASIEADLAKAREASHQEVRKVLTEEQRVRFDARSSQQMAKRRGRGQGNGAGRGHQSPKQLK